MGVAVNKEGFREWCPQKSRFDSHRTSKKEDEFYHKVRDLENKVNVKVVLFGTSYVRNLRIENNKVLIWDKYFHSLFAYNMGVGGDTVTDTQSRIKCAPFERKTHRQLHTVFIHSGSNDATIHSALQIAEGIMYCAIIAVQKCPFIKVVISALIPRKKPKPHCSIHGMDENMVIAEVNILLKNL